MHPGLIRTRIGTHKKNEYEKGIIKKEGNKRGGVGVGGGGSVAVSFSAGTIPKKRHKKGAQRYGAEDDPWKPGGGTVTSGAKKKAKLAEKNAEKTQQRERGLLFNPNERHSPQEIKKKNGEEE